MGRGALHSPHSLPILCVPCPCPFLCLPASMSPTRTPPRTIPAVMPPAQALFAPRVRVQEWTGSAPTRSRWTSSKRSSRTTWRRGGGRGIVKRYARARAGPSAARWGGFAGGRVAGGVGWQDDIATCTANPSSMGWDGARAGSPTPHTYSSIPHPQSPPLRAKRGEARNLSPSRLAGVRVGLSSAVAIALAIAMTLLMTPIVIIIIIIQ